MANVDAPSGFSAVRQSRGGCVRNSEPFTIAPGYSTNLYEGDPVKKSGTGRDVILSAPGGELVGQFQGCQYLNGAGEVIYANKWTGDDVKSGSVPVANVLSDPDIVFVAQIDGNFVAADVGKTYDHTAAGSSGNDSTGTSGVELDYSTGVAEDNASPGQFQSLGLADIPGNAYGSNAKVECLAVLHSRLGPGRA